MTRGVLILFAAQVLITQAACTKSADGSTPLSSIIDQIIAPAPDSPKVAEKQITAIQADLNKDQAYALNPEDQTLLVSEGLVESEDQLKAWVK